MSLSPRARGRRQREAASSGGETFVIIGGGAAGLELATRLGKRFGRTASGSVTLVDKHRTHLWKPLLHEIAAGSMDLGHRELNYLAQAHWHGFRFRLGELAGLDRSARQVIVGPARDEDGREITPLQRLAYDTLVIAVGGEVNDFGTPGVAEHAHRLDSAAQANRFHRRLVDALISADAAPGPLRPGQLQVAIIGAGATGVELAAELHRTVRQLVAYGLNTIQPERDITIHLIEAAPRVLPALPPRIADGASALLARLRVRLHVGATVKGVDAEGVDLADGRRIPAELVVWAAGVRAPALLDGLGLETNRAHQLVVGDTLQTQDENVFAIGDCASAPWLGTDRRVPPRAQAAHQQASHLYRQFRRRAKGLPLEPFQYRDLGSLVSLGDYSAVGALMGRLGGRELMVEGFVARMMYRSLHTMHELALHGPLKVTLDSVARAITRGVEPQVKLH